MYTVYHTDNDTNVWRVGWCIVTLKTSKTGRNKAKPAKVLHTRSSAVTERPCDAVSLNILLSNSRSLEVIRNDIVAHGVCKSQLAFRWNYVCHTVYEIFSIKVWRDLETGGRGHSRSLKMAPFDRSYMTFYWSAIVSIAVCCTIFELFDVESNQIKSNQMRDL